MNSLYCGIAGYIGNNFNKQKFNILGLYNDSRGGDSCGIFVGKDDNKSVRYGHDKTKLYKNFVELGGLKDVDLESPDFALLHCRKASVGGISLETAQPVIIRNANNKVVFAMIHNGTLVNYKELANKYNVDFAFTETDSQIFCKTVYKAGYEVLSEYDGAGAFVFWDGRDGNDTIKVFRGASMYYENDDTVYIERPLFYIKENNSFWFSSMEESLEFINESDAKVENIISNTLLTIKNGKVIAEDYIDRSKRKQADKLQVNWEKQKADRAKNDVRNYHHYDNYEDIWGQNNNYNRYSERSEYNANILENGATDCILKPLHQYKDKIYFNTDGLYYINGTPCNGPIEATPAGFVNITTVAKNMYYFVYGVLMASYFDYLCATQFVSQNFAEDDDCIEMYLAAYSPTPVPYISYELPEVVFIDFYTYNKELMDTELFNGWFEPFFNFKRDRYIVKNGSITWHYEYSNACSYYYMPTEKQALDNQILSGKISKNEVKKMIKRNLKSIYAKH
jgi:predicted glutamine amidotransferase